MSLTVDNVYQILDFLDANENCSLAFDAGNIKVTITKGNAVAPAPAAAPAPAVAAAPAAAPAAVPAAAPVAAPVEAPAPAAEEPKAAPAADTAVDESKLVPVTANVASVFYRAPSPTEPPFVEVGDEVDESTCVCLLEVMKCFYQTPAGVKGKVAKILVNDADVVEAGTVLFLIDPV